MSFLRTMDFPDTKITADPEKANYQNYQAWQAHHAQRKREAATQFNMFQLRSAKRMYLNTQYKEEAEREAEALRDMIERRLSRACDCENCLEHTKSRSNSDASFTPGSPTNSVSSSVASLDRISSQQSTRPNMSKSASSRNSLIISPPPRSRHHQRRAQRGGVP